MTTSPGIVFRVFATTSLLLSAPVDVMSQEQPEPNPYESGSGSPSYETVVSADRTEMPLFEANRSISAVKASTREEQQPQTTPEMTTEQSGVFLQQTNAGAGSPIIRGLIGPQNAIYIDGNRYSNSTYRTGPNQYLATVSPWALQRMEIVRGPSSVLYGSGAMGGVISLHTENPANLPRDSHGRVAFGYATANNAPVIALQVHTNNDTVAALVGGDYATFGELEAGDGLKQPFTDYNSGSWRGKVVFTPEDSPLTVTGAYLGNYINNAGRIDNLGRGEVRLTSNADHFIWMNLRWDIGDVLRHIGVNASYHQMQERTDRHNCPVTGGKYNIDPACMESSTINPAHRMRRYEDVIDTFGLETQMALDLLWQRLTVLSGLDFYYDSVNSSLENARGSDSGMVLVEQDRGNYSSGSYYATFGVFLNGDLKALKTRFGDLHFTAGGRFSNFAAYAPMVPGFDEDIHYSYNGFVTAAGVQWLVDEAFNFFGSYNQGFRAPNLQETTVLGDTGSKFEIPNPDLAPERSDTFELGLRLRYPVIDFDFTWFRSLYRDIIDERSAEWDGQNTVDGKPVVQRTNASSGTYQGVEAAVAVHPIPPLTLSTTATWMKGEVSSNTDEGVSITYPARRIPPLFGTSALRYDHKKNDRFFAEFYVNWAGDQEDLHPQDIQDLRICETGYLTGELYQDVGEQCPGTKSWYTLNLRGGVRFMQQARVVVTLANLTDNRYKTHGSGILAPGFDGRATLIVGF